MTNECFYCLKQFTDLNDIYIERDNKSGSVRARVCGICFKARFPEEYEMQKIEWIELCNKIWGNKEK